MSLSFKTTTDSIITKIPKDKKVVIFYNPFNPFSFISAYIFKLHFQSISSLDKLSFIKVYNYKDIFINRKDFLNNYKDSVFIFLDCPLNKDVFIYYGNKVSSYIGIDDQKSSYSVTKDSIQKTWFMSDFSDRISFSYIEGCCSTALAWRFVTNDPVPRFINKLQDIYSNFRKFEILDDYYLSALSYSGSDFNELDLFLTQEFDNLELLREKFIVTNFTIKHLISSSFANAKICTIKNKPAIVLNVSSSLNDCLFFTFRNKIFQESLNTTAKLVISYCMIKDEYKVTVTTNENIDLLKLFSKYKPFGNSDYIYFYTKKDIKELEKL